MARNPPTSISPGPSRSRTLSPASARSSISPSSPTSGPLILRTRTRERTLITGSLRSTIRGLRNHAAWTFRRIAQEIGIATATVFSICRAPATPQKKKPGRPEILTTPLRKRLIDFATASQKNRRLPLREVAELAGVDASPDVLRTAFATEGYHRRVARARPFLSLQAKEKRLDWAKHYADWTRADWHKVTPPPLYN